MGRWRKPAAKSEVPPEAEGAEGADRRPSQRESALWASRLTIDGIAALVTISMSKTGLTDDDMERWCCWLKLHLAQQQHCTLGLVDFAENRLTAKGVRHLLATFLDLQLPVQVLKLHHNRIAEGSCFAAYLQRGWLHELHLSHNELDAQASATIIEAAASAAGEEAMTYPRRVGKGNSAPLWVRLEQNYIDPNLFSSILDAKFGDSGRNICCDARSKWCTPHNCIQQAAYVVHLKNLFQQRRRGPSGSQAAPATGSTTRKADGSETAHVLCFDWERGAWVPESIDIPVIDTTATEAMSEGLKVLIGAGMSRPTDRENPVDKPMILSQEEGQSMGADLLHSIRKKPAVPAPVPAPAAMPSAPRVAPPAMAVAAPLVAAARQQAAAQAAAAQAAAAQAAAAQAAATQAHLARVAAAHLLAASAGAKPSAAPPNAPPNAAPPRPREEDPNAWLRVEAPVFHPGARCFFATSEAPESQSLSAETSAGAASDDTESVEVTAGSAGISGDATDEPTETGLSNTESPQSKTTRQWEEHSSSSPAAWLSKAAPLLEDLPATSLWKKDAKSVKKMAVSSQAVRKVAGSVAAVPSLAPQKPSPVRLSTTPMASQGLSKLNSPGPKTSQPPGPSMDGIPRLSLGAPTTAAEWLSSSPECAEKLPDSKTAGAVPILPPKIGGLSDSSEAKSAQKTVSAISGPQNAEPRKTGPTEPPLAPTAEPVPPEIEKPLVVHEERPEVVGLPEEASTLPPEVAAPELGGSAEMAPGVGASSHQAPVEAVEAPVAAEQLELGASAGSCQQDTVSESKNSCGKETQEFPSARVHQVFNILDDEHRSRSHSDSSPCVLEVWKVEHANPEHGGTPTNGVTATNTPSSSMEASKQGQCHVM